MILSSTLNGCMEDNLSAKISLSSLSIYEKIVTCKRDPEARDRDETETLGKCVSRPSRDRDVETETTSLHHGAQSCCLMTEAQQHGQFARCCYAAERSQGVKLALIAMPTS